MHACKAAMRLLLLLLLLQRQRTIPTQPYEATRRLSSQSDASFTCSLSQLIAVRCRIAHHSANRFRGHGKQPFDALQAGGASSTEHYVYWHALLSIENYWWVVLHKAVLCRAKDKCRALLLAGS
jgi:hypothetical protein